MPKAKPPIPVFSTPIIETHCHLDYLDADQLPETLARCAAVGIDRIVTIAVSPDNLATVRQLAAMHDAVWATQGVHPHEAEAFTADAAGQIAAAAADAKVVAVGEIGLDYYYDHADRAVQRRVFETQLELAIDAELPIVVHTREADDDTMAILRNATARLSRKGVIHSFTSGRALAEYCLSEGFMLGFNGIATFNKADNVREIVALTPDDQLVIETDSPYLTPVPYRGVPNAPFYLPFVAEFLARFRDQPVEIFLATVRANSERLFAF
ncbi:MAG: TatD family hydrolase [Pseudomonadota bacterium]